MRRPCDSCPAANGPSPCIGLRDEYETLCARAREGGEHDWVWHIHWRSGIANGEIVLPDAPEPGRAVREEFPVAVEAVPLAGAGLVGRGAGFGGCDCGGSSSVASRGRKPVERQQSTG